MTHTGTDEKTVVVNPLAFYTGNCGAQPLTVDVASKPEGMPDCEFDQIVAAYKLAGMLCQRVTDWQTGRASQPEDDRYAVLVREGTVGRNLVLKLRENSHLSILEATRPDNCNQGKVITRTLRILSAGNSSAETALSRMMAAFVTPEDIRRIQGLVPQT